MRTSGARTEHLCTKRPYPDRALAEATLTGLHVLGALGIKGRQERRVYFCSQCRSWHLTSRGSIPPHVAREQAL